MNHSSSGASRKAAAITAYLLPFLPLCLIGLIAVAHAAIKPFWYDELATFYPASLPTWKACWNFYAAGLDTPSPLPALLVHGMMGFHGPAEIIDRLPMIVGFLVMCLSLYGFTSRRYGRGYSLAALILPSLMGVFYYSTEMRAYAIVLGSVAFALWCWQSAQRERCSWCYQFGVLLGLAMAIGCHIFAVFVIPAFLVGQWLHERITKNRSLGMWAAILLSPCSLFPQLDGIFHAHRFYGAIFWSKPDLGLLFHSYDFIFAFGWFIPVVAVLFIGFLLARLGLLPQRGEIDTGYTQAEWALAGMLALKPFLALPFSYLIGAYCPRYVLAANLGITLLLVGGTAEALKRNRFAGGLLATFLITMFLALNLPKISKVLSSGINLPEAIASQEEWLRILEARKDPVVIVPDANLFLVIQHYGSPELRKRLYYVRGTGCTPLQNNNDDLNILLFSQRFPFLTMDYPTFRQAHSQFLVVVYHFLEDKTAADLGLHLSGHFRSKYLNNHAPQSVSIYEENETGKILRPQ